jgi:uncharacterized protein (DUF2132 family)
VAPQDLKNEVPGGQVGGSRGRTMTPPVSHPRDPLHGITLETILKQLVQRHGWSEMGRRIPVRCFQFNPSVKSSLTFLRKTPWARKKVEAWFIAELPPIRQNKL